MSLDAIWGMSNSDITEKITEFQNDLLHHWPDITEDWVAKLTFIHLFIDLNPFIPQNHKEISQKQLLLLTENILEILFGGAAGGGKSDGLLMAALMFVCYPNYHAIMFRQTYTDLALPDSLMDRADKWLRGTDAHWDDKTKTWVFPSGATLTFAYLQGPRDKYRYQGAAFQFIAFDELTQFKEQDYLFLFSRLRKSVNDPIPLRMRSASNPGGVGHDWVKSRFIETEGSDITFIKSLLTDNPFLDQDAYRQSLAKLDPVTRRQMEEGDWDIGLEGEMFKRHWFPLVPGVDTRYTKHRVRFWDLASTAPGDTTKDPDFCASCLMGMAAIDDYCVSDITNVRYNESETEAFIASVVHSDGPGVIQVFEREGGSDGKLLHEAWKKTILKGVISEFIPSRHSKIIRAKLPSAAAERGEIKLLEAEWNKMLLDQLTKFPNVLHDDMCLVEDTIISTIGGDVPISKVMVGDVVLTSDGYHKVLAAGMTSDSASVYKVDIENGAYIIGTGNHPILTQRGWVGISDLIPGDIIWQIQRKSYSTGLNLEDTPIPKLWHIQGISGRMQDILKMALGIYTKKFGNLYMGISHRITVFTTRMEIISIMIYRILNACSSPTMQNYIWENMLKKIKILSKRNWIKFGISPLNGTIAQKVKSGIYTMQKKLLETKNVITCVYAQNAVKSSYHLSMGQNFVRVNAGIDIVEKSSQIDEYAQCVGVNSSHIKNQEPEYVLKNVCVLSVERKETPQKVYNLTVDHAHTYFANGILVHNCDCISGCFSYLQRYVSTVKNSDLPKRGAIVGRTNAIGVPVISQRNGFNSL